jgi:hypothetical protein
MNHRRSHMASDSPSYKMRHLVTCPLPLRIETARQRFVPVTPLENKSPEYPHRTPQPPQSITNMAQMEFDFERIDRAAKMGLDKHMLLTCFVGEPSVGEPKFILWSMHQRLTVGPIG